MAFGMLHFHVLLFFLDPPNILNSASSVDSDNRRLRAWSENWNAKSVQGVVARTKKLDYGAEQWLLRWWSSNAHA